MKKAFLFVLIILYSFGYSQTYKIKYGSYFEGKADPNKDKTIVIANPQETYILSNKILLGSQKPTYEIQKISYKETGYESFAVLENDRTIATTNNELLSKYSLQPTSETKEILGHPCKKVETTINSNKMEIWYTTDLPVKGGPNVLAYNLGLVLEITRNGNNTTRAEKIEKIRGFDIQTIFHERPITKMDALSYADEIWRSKFTTIPVFKDEIINFSSESKSDEHIQRFANGTVILKKIKFPDLSKNQQIFVELHEQSNGDAYDRTGSVFVIPTDREKSFYDALSKGIQEIPVYDNGNGNEKKYQGVVLTPDYLPTLELMRFFTPFGIEKYNHIQLKDKTWQEVVRYRQDISDLHPLLSNQELWVGTFIGNYDKGGHQISLEISIHPNSDNAQISNNFALPLFNSTNLMEMAGQNYATMFNSPKGLVVEFELKKPLQNGYLRYISTGHGGWENGDEFVPKENRIFLDDKKIFNFIPWRTDCGSYRLYNPASGNFSNGLSSSDYSRSNWCPATATNPAFISLGDLPAGKHQIQIQITQGEKEGSSFSAWNVSGVLLGTEK